MSIHSKTSGTGNHQGQAVSHESAPRHDVLKAEDCPVLGPRDVFYPYYHEPARIDGEIPDL